MEAEFPQDEGFAGQFLTGFRKDPAAPQQTQMVGVAVLKRTYRLSAGGGLEPAPDALPLFEKDVPDNLVANSDLVVPESGGPPEIWEAVGSASLQRVPDPDDGDLWNLRVTGAGAQQTLESDKPIGGETFTLSFQARSASGGTLSAARLEADAADGSTRQIAVAGAALAADFGGAYFEVTGTWPADLDVAELRLVLPGSGAGIDYRHIQVERRGHRTVYAPSTTVRYESDLAPYKPVADVVVLGRTDRTGPASVAINGASWLSDVTSAASAPFKALFGWEPKTSDARKALAGTFSTNPDDYPPLWPPPFERPGQDPLPGAGMPTLFDNLFNNGYRRTAFASPGAAIPAGATVAIERDGVVETVTIENRIPAAQVYLHDGTGPDEPAHWISSPLDMRLDTFVIEPEAELCYAVWRGVFAYDPAAAYRRLVVEAGEAA